MKYAFKQANRPYQTFNMSDLGLKNKPMTGHRPGLGLQFFGRPGSGLVKPCSA